MGIRLTPRRWAAATGGLTPRRSRLNEGVAPTEWFPIPIGHDAVELPVGGLEHQRQEKPIPLPQRQLQQTVYRHPFEGALRVVRTRLAGPTVEHEDEAEPVLPVFAEAGPADGAAQAELDALQASLLADLAAEAGHHVLARVELAAQAVVLAE